MLKGLSFPDKIRAITAITAITKLSTWEIYRYTGYTGELDFQNGRSKSENIENNTKPLTPAQMDKIQHIKNMVHIKITHYKTTQNREDIDTLYEGNWLNDKVINVYMKMIEDRSNHPNSPYLVKATSTFNLE